MAFLPLAVAAGGAILNYMGQREGADIAQRGLEETRRANAAAERLARAARTDAYGNRLSYDDALNEWISQLTPEQKSLALAGEREQRLGLTQDAARNRLIQAMQQARGRQADEALRSDLANYAATSLPNEGAIRSALTRLISQSTPQTGPRIGGGGLGAITVGNANLGTGPTQRLAKILLQARQGALSEMGPRTATRAGGLASTGALSNLIAGGQTGPARLPTTAQEANARQDAALQQMLATMQHSSTNLANATKTAAGTAPKLDLRGMAALYTALNRNQPGGRTGQTDVGSAVQGSNPFGGGGGGRDLFGGFGAGGDTVTANAPPNWLDTQTLSYPGYTGPTDFSGWNSGTGWYF